MTEELQDEPSLAATPLRPKDPPDLLEQDAFNELDAISLREILDQDSRPTFIYDLDSDYNGDRNNELRPVFCNAALQEHDRLLDSVTGDDGAETPPAPPSTSHEQFKSWVTSVTKFDDSGDIYPLTLMFKNMLWTGCTIRRRWRIISGNQCYDTSYLPRGGFTGGSPKDNSESGSITIRAQPDLSSPDPRLDRTLTNDIETAPIPGTDTGQTNSSSPSRNRTPRALRPKVPFRKESSLETVNTTVSSSTITLASPENSVIDWTAKNPTGVLSEHLKFARSIDWAATPLGPMETWTPAFRELTNVMMRNGHPCGIYWGEELTVLYNEPYAREIAGNKHPDLMGTGFSGPFSEIWDAVAPQFQECVRTGKSFRVDHSVFALERFGYVEEVYFCYGIVPAYGGTDRIQGFVIPAYDTSYETINHRRMQTLRQFGEKVSQARSLKHFWSCVLDGFVDNPNDFPFALLYSISDTEEGDGESHSSDANVTLKSCVLEGSIGIPDGHPASPPILDLNKSTEGFVPAFREAMRTREPTILHTRDGTLPEHLLKGIEWRGFGDPCREAIIIPVRPTHNENVVAFLLVGMNPRRAYDEDYQTFSAMLNRQLATSLAAFLLFEDEVRRSRSAVEVATLQQEQIAQQLAVQTDRMKRMTELSPFGMFFFSPEGVLLEANDRYYEMTNQSRDDKNELGFLSLFVGESVQAALDMWNGLVTGLKPLTYELQLKNPDDRARDVEGEPMEIWILATSIPEVDSDGKLKSIMGSLADISHMKWVQGLQDRRLREAEETKRQQNEFIDITSHEMRNPLSAILVCADDIRDTLTGHQFRNEDAVVIKECVEAANNIVLCVQHQKSIVDDILTVSKLDSNLLHIIPTPVQPVTIIQRAMSMFRPEVTSKDIKFDFITDASFQRLNIDWVNLDPGRLLQITVNLITNAIKFTSPSAKRNISVYISASVERPDLQEKGFEYVPLRVAVPDVTAGEDWGDGEIVHIHVEVKDTGCGLTPEEKDKLFERFAQASQRTHVQYGGSGLGLFISRQLSELHGGRIGVSSEAGVGSTFAFFIRARRVPTPSSALQTISPIQATSPMHSTSPINPTSLIQVTSSIQNASPIQNTSPLQATSPTQATSPVQATSPEQATSPIKTDSSVPAFDSPEPSPPPTINAPTLESSKPEPQINQDTADTSLHVLLVEDNLVNQRVVSKQLKKAGCHVTTAENGVFALKHLATTHFQKPGSGVPLSIVFCDWEMPEMDGLTCVARIREMQAKGEIQGHVPVIGVTANVRGEQIAQARKAGMDDVVGKPFRVPQLLIKARELLDRLAEEALTSAT